MKILFINSVCGFGSTGRICCELADKYTLDGNECKIAYGRGCVPEKYKKYSYKIGTVFDVYWHVLITRLFDKHGLASKRATRSFIKWAEEYNPDLLWLHNIHGYYINYEILFKWIKSRPNMKVKWTLHDCWTFTGHCSHFMYANCNQWIYDNNKMNCEICKQVKEYPKSFLISNSRNNFMRKVNAFSNVKNMEIITPSKWLASEVNKSFLNKYNLTVRYNDIDTQVFKYTENNIKDKYGISDKVLLLGVANVWNKKKGVDDFIKLSSMLGDNYVIMLIGVDDKTLMYITKKIHSYFETLNNRIFIRKKNIVCKNYSFKLIENKCIDKGVDNIFEMLTGKKYNNQLSFINKLILINKVSNKSELAKYYSACDCFINPTYEDNYPTVNLEAIACNTKVITYNVGGCCETLNNVYSKIL